jgi:Uma2 family endonuclease
MPKTSHPVTAGELARFPADDRRYELVEGRLVRMTPVNFLHGRTVIEVAFLLRRHLEQHPNGAIATEVGFLLASDPDTVRAPDLAFVRRERVPPQDERGFFEGPPDLAVEVLSPDDRPAEVRDKVADYLAHGVPLVAVLDPAAKTVTVHRPAGQPVVQSGGDDVLDLSEILPGFRCRLREIFG